MFQKLIDAKSCDALLVMVHPWYPWMPPLGLVYVSTYLRNKGYRALVFDFNTKLYNSVSEDKKKLWNISTISEVSYPELVKLLSEGFSKEIQILIELICQRPEPIIGFSVNYLNIAVASQIARIIKEKCKHKLIVLGGPGCFWEYEREFIEPGLVDTFVIGEGEFPFYEIVEKFYRGQDYSTIKGTICYRNGKGINNLPVNPILNLDEIPFPTFEEIDLDDYNFGQRQSRTLPLLISRGCISKCSFCVDYIMCHPFRMRSPQNVINEIEYHINVNNVKNFSFNDLLCNGHLVKLEKLCDLIIERGFKIEWGSYAMARGDMSFELLEKMKQAGCSTICYGIESGSDNVLRMMNKLYNSADAEKVLRLTHRAGIKATFNIIIGHPGEGKKEFKETLSFIKRNKDYINSIINVSTLFINPTAKLGLEPQKYNLYFPKTPRSFKFINLMKYLVPKYYRVFGRSVPVPELKGIDISEFVDTKMNTKAERLKRLITTLKFITKLGLFREDPIINVYLTKNKKIRKIIDVIDKRWAVGNKYIFLRCDYKGYAKLLYNDKILTSDSGLVAAFRVDNQWYDTSKYNWEIKKLSPNSLRVLIYISDLKITGVWKLKIKRNRLICNFRIKSDKNIKLKELKLGIILDENYFYWSSDKFRGALFLKREEKWSIIPLEKLRDNKIVLASRDKNFPQIYFSKSKIVFFQLEIPNLLKGKFIHTVIKDVSLNNSCPINFRYCLEFRK